MSVVIAFISDYSGRILITQRSLDSHYGGYWELPGGKIENEEKPLDALIRELKEELDLTIDKALLFDTIDCGAIFFLFHVQSYIGQLSLKVNQLSSTWVLKDELNAYRFPHNNKQFFDAWFNYLEFDNSHIDHKTGM